jgi:ribosomal protein S18 acetylase RimI-like enzyme
MTALNLVRITRPDDAAFNDAIYIYETAIAKPEQKTRAQMLAGLRDPAFRFWALERGGAVVAVSVIYVSEALNFALLEYLAVSPACQGQGLGADMYRRSWSASRLDDDTILLIEVDSETEETGETERLIRLRRKQFYRRLGCVEVRDFRYIYPLENFGTPPRMNLLVAGSDAGEIATAQLRRAVEDIYLNVYQRPQNDARLADMFAGHGAALQLG